MNKEKEEYILKLNNLKPNEINNPKSKITIGATLFSFIQVVIFLSWFYWSFYGYIEWYNGNGKLPDTSIVKVGIPLFILSIIIEFTYGLIQKNLIKRKGELVDEYQNILPEQYRLSDTISSFSNGIIQQLIEMWTTLIGEMFGLVMITAVPYKWIYENYGLTRMLEGNALGFVFMFFARDFCYYWFHRAAHRCAFMWAVHGVHHMPSSFSYHVNLSQGGIQRITSALFYAPLALFCPPEIYTIIFPMQKMYGFFTHTCVVDKCHWLISSIFVTPSSHRVHHSGAPVKYLDKNYGEMLSIWDRMFGTHQEEDVPVVFGICYPIDTWNPLKAQLYGWQKIIEKTKTTSNPIDKLLCFLMPPGWCPILNDEFDLNKTPLKNATPYNSNKYDSRLPTNVLKFYLSFWFIPTLSIAIYLIRMYSKFTLMEMVIIFSFVIYSLFSFGVMSDLNPRSIIYDTIRLILAPIVIFKLPLISSEIISNLTIITTLISLVSFFILLSHSDHFKFETQKQREKRIWIKEIGRDYTNKLLNLNLKLNNKSE